MTEGFDPTNDAQLLASEEVKKHEEASRFLVEIDWINQATVFADAYMETRSHEDFQGLLGAAALALRQTELKKEINGLEKQFRL